MVDDWSIRGADKRKRTSPQPCVEKDPRKRSRVEEEWKIKGGRAGSRPLAEINKSQRESKKDSYPLAIRSERGDTSLALDSASSPHIHPDRQHNFRHFDSPPPPPNDIEYPLSPRSRSPDSLFVSDAHLEEKRESKPGYSQVKSRNGSLATSPRGTSGLRIDTSRSPLPRGSHSMDYTKSEMSGHGHGKVPSTRLVSPSSRYDSYRPSPSDSAHPKSSGWRSEPRSDLSRATSGLPTPKTSLPDDTAMQPPPRTNLLQDINEFGEAIVKSANLKMQSTFLVERRASEEQINLRFGRHKNTFVALTEHLGSQADETDRAEARHQELVERNKVSEADAFFKLANKIQTPTTSARFAGSPALSDVQAQNEIAELRESLKHMQTELEYATSNIKMLEKQNILMQQDLDGCEFITRQRLDTCVKKELVPIEDKLRVLYMDRSNRQDENNVVSNLVKSATDMNERMSEMNKIERVPIKAFREAQSKIVAMENDVGSISNDLRDCKIDVTSQAESLRASQSQFEDQRNQLHRLRLPTTQNGEDEKDLMSYIDDLDGRTDRNRQEMQRVMAMARDNMSTIIAGHDPSPDGATVLDDRIEAIVEANLEVMRKKHETELDNFAEELEKINDKIEQIQKEFQAQHAQHAALAPIQGQLPSPPQPSAVPSPYIQSHHFEMRLGQLHSIFKALETTVFAQQQAFNRLTSRELANTISSFVAHRYPPFPATLPNDLNNLIKGQTSCRTELDKLSIRVNNVHTVLLSRPNTLDVAERVKHHEIFTRQAFAEVKEEMAQKALQSDSSTTQNDVTAISGKLSQLEERTRADAERAESHHQSLLSQVKQSREPGPRINGHAGVTRTDPVPTTGSEMIQSPASRAASDTSFTSIKRKQQILSEEEEEDEIRPSGRPRRPKLNVSNS